MKLGFDICDVERMRKLLLDDRFLNRYFTPEEAKYIRLKNNAAAESMAGIYAAKEALLKALGTGITVDLREISVCHDAESGAPYYMFSGTMTEKMRRFVPSVSISHDGGMAGAVCLLEIKEE